MAYAAPGLGSVNAPESGSDEQAKSATFNLDPPKHQRLNRICAVQQAN
jgi:hypothetical protein